VLHVSKSNLFFLFHFPHLPHFKILTSLILRPKFSLRCLRKVTQTIINTFQTLSIQIYPLYPLNQKPRFFPFSFPTFLTFLTSTQLAYLVHFNILTTLILRPEFSPAKILSILTLKVVCVSGVLFFTKTHNKTSHFVTFFSIFLHFFLFFLFSLSFCNFFFNFLTFLKTPTPFLAQNQG